MRKEYNDRWNAPLVNPGFTMDEYELQRIKDRLKKECDHREIELTGKAETENLHCSCGFSIPF